MTCMLALSHGPADSESSLSLNKKMLREDQSTLSDADIDGCCKTKDAIIYIARNVHNMEVGEDVIAAS